ncbi:acyl carrier protein [Micromonospora mangrovi]|uniref:Acyl carrier protein n=2 Tax=Micromonospora TaxID=1873 RepID=A0AAU8HFR1_9ACTN
MSSIQDRITRTLVEEFRIPPGAITQETSFTDLGFDSLVIVELALVLDQRFGVALKDGELAETMTLAAAADLLAAKGAVP